MAHLHEVYDSDTNFIIDPETREITNETSKKVTLIQGDHNSERFTFQIESIDGHNMMQCNHVTIHYINIDALDKTLQSKGVYEVNDMKRSSDGTTLFTWLLTENVTKYVGSLAFCIRFECVTNGVVEYKWHTGICKKFVIAESIDNAEEITEAFPDILAQWKAELFEAGGDAVVNVNTAKAEALTAIQEEGAAQVENVKAVTASVEASLDQIHKNHMTKAVAIVGSAEGEVILLDDSAEQPFVGFQLFGKSEQETINGFQLLDLSNIATDSGGTTTVEVLEEGKTIKVTGTKSYGMALVDIAVSGLVGNTIYLYGSVTDGNNPAYTIRKIFSDGTKEYLKFATLSSDGYTIEEGVEIIEVQFVCNNTTTTLETAVTAVFENAILTLEKDASWEKYTGGIPSPNPQYPQEIKSVENPEVGVYGVNFIDAKSLQVSSNTSLEVSDDGYTIKATGGTTSGWCSSIYELPAELVKILRGKKVFTKCDSFVSEQSATGARAGFNVTLADGTTVYPASVGLTNMAVTETINKNAVRIVFAVYANNSGRILETDNTITIKGLRVSILDYIDWKPYKEFQSVFLPYTLHGEGEAADKIMKKDGKWGIERHFKKAVYDSNDFAEITWAEYENATFFTLPKPEDCDTYGQYWTSDAICNKFRTETVHPLDQPDIVGNITTAASAPLLWFGFPKGTTLEEAKSVGEIEYIYRLAKPVFEPFTDEEQEAFKDLLTKYPYTTILNDCGANMTVKYGIDTKIYIDKKFAELQAMILGES